MARRGSMTTAGSRLGSGGVSISASPLGMSVPMARKARGARAWRGGRGIERAAGPGWRRGALGTGEGVVAHLALERVELRGGDRGRSRELATEIGAVAGARGGERVGSSGRLVCTIWWWYISESVAPQILQGTRHMCRELK